MSFPLQLPSLLIPSQIYIKIPWMTELPHVMFSVVIIDLFVLDGSFVSWSYQLIQTYESSAISYSILGHFYSFFTTTVEILLLFLQQTKCKALLLNTSFDWRIFCLFGIGSQHRINAFEHKMDKKTQGRLNLI